MLADMDNLQQHYAAPHGAFLVLLDDERVVERRPAPSG
jgi:hypothetical protein